MTPSNAMSFRLLPKGQRPTRLAPRGLVGDGSHRCALLGATTTVMIHSRVGWGAALCTADWDSDGITDLLCGAERNCLLFFRNEGTNREPRLVNKGFVRADGKPLALPVEPVPKSPPGVYLLDYYPVPEPVDWNGDGRIDLLAGGFITGRVYFYENLGKSPDSIPRLAFRGPLEADGKPLNVGDWAAAPTAADFDNDGDLDLICGNMPLTAGGGDSADPDTFLRYYVNVGHPQEAASCGARVLQEGQVPFRSAGDTAGSGPQCGRAARPGGQCGRECLPVLQRRIEDAAAVCGA